MGEDWLTIEADYYAYLARNCTDHRRMSVFHDEFANGGIDWASCRLANRSDSHAGNALCIPRRIPNLFKKRPVVAGTVPKLTNT